jgi:aminoglycoside phosphotransferase (APT) family kinase protein
LEKLPVAVEAQLAPGGQIVLDLDSFLGAGHWMTTYGVLRKITGGGHVDATTRTRTITMFGGFHGGVNMVYSDAQGFPVAKPVLYCSDEAIAGTAFYVMDFVDGRVFWEPQMPGSNPTERTAIYNSMNETIARLHTFDPAKIDLGDFGRGENYVARQVERWSKQYRASQTQPIDEMEQLIEWLPAHIPPSGPMRLVHGDYRLDNMIFDTGSTRVLAVLDWELSTLGDALADFSYHLMAWHMPPEETGAGTGSLVGHDLKAPGIPSATDYVEMYHARTGFDPRPQLSTYLAYNFFRIAAILQGIAGRVRDGTATNEHAPAKAQMVRPLAETAWRFAREAGAR